MGRTPFEKIWDRHLVIDLGEGTGLLLIDRVLLHERTNSVAPESLATAGWPAGSGHRSSAGWMRSISRCATVRGSMPLS